MWQLSQAIDGITKACEELNIPITGGNVSLYNETLGEGIYPTPVLGVVGILEDVETTAKMYFRESGRALILLRGSEPGDATDAEIEFGSSEYAKEILDALWGFPPALELEKEAALIQCLIEAIQAGLADSVHDCSEGGLAVALSESCFQKGVGASVRLASGDLPIECVLFGEDASRVVLSCDPQNVKRIQQLAVQHGISAELIGETSVDMLEIFVDGKIAVTAPVADLRADFEGALENALQSDPAVMAAD